jgi:hypothetical protein
MSVWGEGQDTGSGQDHGVLAYLSSLGGVVVLSHGRNCADVIYERMIFPYLPVQRTDMCASNNKSNKVFIVNYFFLDHFALPPNCILDLLPPLFFFLDFLRLV